MSYLRILVGTLLLAGACDCSAPPDDDDDDDDDRGGEGEGEGEGECTLDIDCVDNDPCTQDRCEANACVHPAALDGTGCGEDPCLGNSACVAGVCTAGVTPDIDVDNDGHVGEQCFGPDCDDNDPAIFPGQDEGGGDTCSDGADNDCDGGADALDTTCGSTVVCDAGWCWENPLPHGFGLFAVWPFSSTDAWVGGTLGGVAHWDGSEFAIDEPQFQGFALQFARMWASSSNDIWASGGAMVHYDGASWSVDLSSVGANAVNAIDVWGFAPDDVWASGTSGRTLHYDGVAWTQDDPGIGTLFAIHGSAPDDVWVGGQGKVARFNGNTWSQFTLVPDPANFLFTGIWANAPDDVWFAGDFGVLWHFDGQTFTSHPAAQSRRMISLVGFATNDVWAVGDGGIIMHWNGSTWGTAAIFNVAQWTGLRAASPTEMWAVGTGSAIARFDGEEWTRIGQPENAPDEFLSAIAVSNGDAGVDAWAFGQGLFGTIAAHRQADGRWRRDPSFSSLQVARTAFATAPNDVWFFGFNGEAQHYDGERWSLHPMPSNVSLVDGCARSATDAWGITGTAILHWDGRAWTVDTDVEPGDDFSVTRHVFCVSPEETWAGGDGLVMRRDGDGNWRRFGVDFWAGNSGLRMHAAAPDNVYAMTAVDFFNDPQPLAHFDGVDWAAAQIPGFGPRGVRDVHGLAPDDLWFAGEIVVHYDGNSFSEVDVGVDDDWQFVYALAPDNVMLVSQRQHTYHWNGATLTPLSQQDGFRDLRDVYFGSTTEGFAVDEFGDLHVWNGATWEFDFTLSMDAFKIHGFAANDVWLAGDRRRAAHWDGNQWLVIEFDPDNFPSDALVDVWGPNPDEVWFVSTSGAVYKGSLGGGFLEQTRWGPGTAIAGSSATDIWIASRDDEFGGAQVIRSDGINFIPYAAVDNVMHMQLVDGRLFAIDEYGSVFERLAGSSGSGSSAFDGGWLQIYNAPEQDDFFDDQNIRVAHFVSPDLAYALGQFGFQRFSGGSGWTFQDMPPAFPSTLQGAGRDVFAVGFAGMILHRSP